MSKILIVIVLLMVSQCFTQDTPLLEQDRILFQGVEVLSPGETLILNFTTGSDNGYYGSYHSDGALIRFTIVSTIFLEAVLEGEEDYIIYREVDSYQPPWEYPSFNERNVSIVYEAPSGEVTQLDYYVIEDTTALEIEATITRIALYPPKFRVSVNFTGGFFDYATCDIYSSHEVNPLGHWFHSENGSHEWQAGRFGSGMFEEFPDDVYNLTIKGYDVFGNASVRVILFTKSSQTESLFLVAALVGVIGLAAIVEFARHRLVRS